MGVINEQASRPVPLGCQLHDRCDVDLHASSRVPSYTDHAGAMRYGTLSNDTLLAAVETGATKLTVDWT
jgi:hypothetical protein